MKLQPKFALRLWRIQLLISSITAVLQWAIVVSKFILLPDEEFFPWFAFGHAIVWSAWAAFCTFKFLKARAHLKEADVNE